MSFKLKSITTLVSTAIMLGISFVSASNNNNMLINNTSNISNTEKSVASTYEQNANNSNTNETGNSDLSIVTNNFWHNQYQKVPYNPLIDHALYYMSDVIENRPEYKLAPDVHNFFTTYLTMLANSLPNNTINIMSKNNIVSLLTNAKKLDCQDKMFYHRRPIFPARTNCNLCHDDQLVNNLIDRLNNCSDKEYIIHDTNLDYFTKYLLLEDNGIYKNIGYNNSPKYTGIIAGINQMPYYDSIHSILQSTYDKKHNKLKYCDKKILTIIKKCLLIPYLNRFFNDKNTNDLCYRVTHFSNGNDYEVDLFINNLSDENSNGLILRLHEYNSCITCEFKNFRKLSPHQIFKYKLTQDEYESKQS
ncbi:MAG: hypothetical protein IJ848_00060 [Alphaproteobacteria bacterium]|nr:hypothetical protein [Alphaproteobacteria bacterium]